MRLSGAAAMLVYLLATAMSISTAAREDDGDQQGHDRHDGQQIFRFDTFGDEQLWTDVLRMHDVIATVDPATALAVGLKVDVGALPQSLQRALRRGDVDLTDPAVTIALLQLNAVVGVKGTIDAQNHLTKVGITCALCHSTVDNSFGPGIGNRLDGWANVDLDVGKIDLYLDDVLVATAGGPGDDSAIVIIHRTAHA